MSYLSEETLGLKAAGVQQLDIPVHREGGTYQWVREVLLNALEARARRILFGLEWQAIESKGVYRRLIADDGIGMSPDDLVSFFRTFGGGGKPIGGIHENYGVGSKTSLLPWNHYGIVIVSWVAGVGSMIWLRRDAKTSEYGLRVFEVEDPDTGELTQESVVKPFEDPEHGCDWSQVGRDWVGEHGTVVVLLGNDPRTDTVEGDPSRPEKDIKGISAYLNRRIWEIPAGTEVHVEELMQSERSMWPRDRKEASARGRGVRTGVMGTQVRQIQGAQHYIEYSGNSNGRLASRGTVPLSDGTEVDWFLWENDRPRVDSYAAISGYTAVLYRNELYDVSDHQATFRSFGITESSVRSRVWLVVRPPEYCERTGRRGIYPRTDRNGLLIQGGLRAGEPLPIHEWAAGFCDQMPDELMDAIRAARAGGSGTIRDAKWRDRLADRFGRLWRISRLRARKSGELTVKPEKPGTQTTSRPTPPRSGSGTSGGSGATGGKPVIGTRRGPAPAVRTKVAGGIPTFRRVRADEMDNPGLLAAWQAHDPEHPEGVVLINVEHPVLESEIDRWRDVYPPSKAEEVKEEVLQVYGELAVSKVAHSEYLKSVLPREVVENELRSGTALTMALLGLMGADSLLAGRLAGRVGRRKLG